MSIERPAFAAQYGASPAPGWRALSDDSEMIEPPAVSRCPACFITMNAPVRQTSTTRRHSATSRSTTLPSVETPALLTTVSSRPCEATTPSRNAATDASSVTSTAGRSATSTRQPSAVNRSAIAAPMPDAPPKTTATRSDFSPMSLLPRC